METEEQFEDRTMGYSGYDEYNDDVDKLGNLIEEQND